MRRFTEAGRRAIAEQNWYAALTIALMIPDICGSMEQPGTGNSRVRYIAWCKKWLQPKFTFDNGTDEKPDVHLSAEDIFQARCSVIHSGSAEIDEKQRNQIDRFEFFSGGSHLCLVIGSVLDGVPQPNFLQLRVDKFSETVFQSAEEWELSVIADPEIQTEKTKLLEIHEPGTTIGIVTF